MSAFVLKDGVAYHTYSTYVRGLNAVWGMYQWLRSRSQETKRDGRLVAPARRVRQAAQIGRVLEQEGGA